MRTLILERRHILGGACVTEEVWPGARVSRASYVVSMLQPKVVADLELKRHGYEAYPLDPAYAAMTPDGPIIFHDDVTKTQASIAKFNKKDAEAYAKFEDLLFMAADFVRPMMIRQPPALGSKAPMDVASLLREAGRIAGMSQRDVQHLVRIFTMSVGDLLDSTVRERLPEGLDRLDRRRRRLGRSLLPRHRLQLPPPRARRARRQHRRLGPGHRRDGRDLRGDRLERPLPRRRHPHERRGREHRFAREGRVTGVTLADGTTFRAPIVASGAHPKTTILDLAGGENFPDAVREDMEAYRTRGGSVKVNMVLSEPPDYSRVPA